MPHESVLEKCHVVTGEAHHDLVIQERYEAPCGESGEAVFDVHKDYDKWIANRTMALLKAEYPGHFWAVESDSKQHILKISIPILMGFMHYYVINLRQTELTPMAVLRAGGEILERYRLPRGMFTDAFFDARRDLSKIVNKRRPIPA